MKDIFSHGCYLFVQIYSVLNDMEIEYFAIE